ncbi:HDOD domain-containing protein [bacterium]|nr:HDOD domain-containing protein [bacterium]
MNAVQDAPGLKERIEGLRSLPTLPPVVEQLCALVEADLPSVSVVGDIIASDQVLASRVLKIINSPFYGFPKRIASINHALVLLGFNVIKGIVVSAAVMDVMSRSLAGLWEHSIGVATVSSQIARILSLPDQEEVSTAGLLHDLGKVVLFVQMRTESLRVFNVATRARIPLIEAERQVLEGVTHPEVAGWLAKGWRLPPGLYEPIIYHHRPALAHQAPVPTAVVHLANILTRALQFGSGGDPYIPKISPKALRTLGLSMSDLASLLEIMHDELERIDTGELLPS